MGYAKLRRRNYGTYTIGIVIFGSILSASFLLQFAFAQTSNNGVFPPGSKLYSLTYGEWTSKWWQWAYSIPKEKNPITDTTGNSCGEGQTGPVWFLAGTTGGPAERTCKVPAGKAILFPVIAAECSYAEYPKLTAEPQLTSCAVTQQEHVTLATTVDGMTIQGLQSYRVQSPLFNFTVPINNIVGIAGGITTKGVSDGYWVFLKPLSAGNHNIHFSGVNTQYAATGVNTYSTEVTYHLIVQ